MIHQLETKIPPSVEEIICNIKSGNQKKKWDKEKIYNFVKELDVCTGNSEWKDHIAFTFNFNEDYGEDILFVFEHDKFLVKIVQDECRSEEKTLWIDKKYQKKEKVSHRNKGIATLSVVFGITFLIFERLLFHLFDEFYVLFSQGMEFWLPLIGLVLWYLFLLVLIGIFLIIAIFGIKKYFENDNSSLWFVFSSGILIYVVIFVLSGIVYADDIFGSNDNELFETKVLYMFFIVINIVLSILALVSFEDEWNKK